MIQKFSIFELSNADYHSNTERLGSTQLKMLYHNPKYYLNWLDKKKSGEADKLTPAIILGQQIHTTLACEQLRSNGYSDEEIDKVYDLIHLSIASIGSMSAPINKTTNEYYKIGSKSMDDWLQIMKYKPEQIVYPEESKMIEQISLNFYNSDTLKVHKSIKQLLFNTEPETSIYTEINGVKIKIRMDLHRFDKRVPRLIIPDWKTCKKEEAQKDNFMLTLARYKYHISGALYVDVAKQWIKEEYGIELRDDQVEFYFIPIEKEEPYDYSIYPLRLDAIDIGRQQYLKAIENYKRLMNDDQQT